MGMSKLDERAQSEYDTSQAMTAPSIAILIMQGNDLPDPDESSKIRLEVNAAEKVRQEISNHRKQTARTHLEIS